MLGNGINSNSDSDLLTNGNILKRFSYFYNLFLDDIKQADLKLELSDAINSVSRFKGNIEEIAAEIYDCVKKRFINKVGYFSGNHEQRIKRFLKEVALNAIFKKEENIIHIAINNEIVRKICGYDTILSLNYYEYWDDSRRSIHLHGKVDFDGNKIKNIDKCVFSPLLDMPKSKSDALYPSEHLFPSDDTFPMGEYTLYKEFEDINEIEIFGVSPTGDNELIEALSKIEKIKIFVYNLNINNQEINSWEKIIKHAEYQDSKEFLT